jgi:hypothetical protein
MKYSIDINMQYSIHDFFDNKHIIKLNDINSIKLELAPEPYAIIKLKEKTLLISSLTEDFHKLFNDFIKYRFNLNK